MRTLLIASGVALAALAGVGAAAFYAVPMTGYAWSWWKLALGL